MVKEKAKKTKSKKSKRTLTVGNIYIQSSFNNTIVTITDEGGDVVTWASAGSIGFKGTKKSTPYAAGLAATSAIEKARTMGLSKANLYVNGVGSGREQAVRALTNSRLEIDIIKDTTPIAHNGCRAKKARRI
ncbi:MAG: 30S ribosomal protein S11 [Candidatus Njordarchaeales archaeon]